MQQRGFVQVKELSKGVESIVSIDREHPQLVQCRQNIFCVYFSFYYLFIIKIVHEVQI